MTTLPPLELNRTRLVDAVELASILRCSRSHVFELAAQRMIPHLRLGRTVRFDVDAVLTATRQEVES